MLTGCKNSKQSFSQVYGQRVRKRHLTATCKLLTTIYQPKILQLKTKFSLSLILENDDDDVMITIMPDNNDQVAKPYRLNCLFYGPITDNGMLFL